MTDGIAIIEINEKGDSRLKELNWFDFRLEDVCFDDAEGADQLTSQLPKEMNNVLVLIVFDYICNCSRSWEGDYDCEELFNIVSHQVLKVDYKEFYRQMVTEELNIGINGFDNIDCVPEDSTFKDGDYYKNLVLEWEDFYDEDFKPFQKEPKRINSVIDLWDVINRG